MTQTNRQEANKDLVKRFVEEVKNQRKLDRLELYFAPNYKEHNETVASFGPGIAGYRNFLGHLFEAFPDDVLTIEMMTADGELVSYRASETGTHKAEFLKIPATGKRATWTEIQFFRVRDGKIVEHWVDVDIFSWFTQLGVIPQMG
jgi:steroid delta-isomerase-like uncharacterized protein